MKSRFKKWDDDWIIEERVDSITRRMANRYYFRKRLCGRVKLVSGLSKQLSGYHLIEKDLRNIADWLNRIQVLMEEAAPNNLKEKESFISPDRDTFQLIKGLFVASITFYGKLFTKAAGRRVKPERSWFVSDELRSEHDDIMSFRHTFAAHSGKDSPESANIVLAIDPVRRRETPPQLFCELMQPDSVRYEDVLMFNRLVKTLHVKVNDKISELNKLIFEKEVIEKGISYLYRQIKGTPNIYMASGCQGKTSPMDRKNKFLRIPLPSLASDSLTSDSLVPACVFGRERQCVLITRLHQTSIGIN